MAQLGYPLQIWLNLRLDIGSDIPVPLDKPTGYGLPYARAKSYVDETISNIEETVKIIKKNKNNSDIDPTFLSSNGEIWTGTIQGAEHFDLVKHSASVLDKMGFQFFAIGSPVELMESYNFSILSQLIKTTKLTIPDKPIHLFGAGHPLTIPLAVALGCDTFDSASYILYAKDNRYMYSHGTLRLEEMSYFPCCCPVCSYYTVKELLDEDRENRITNLAKHNLFILKQEISFVKQSIYDGRLWEYILQKARSHPKLMDAIYTIKNFEYLQNSTPLFKQKAIYLFEPVDQYRPELKNFRLMLINNYKSFYSDILLLYPDQSIRPFYLSSIFKNLIDKYSPSLVCLYNPFFGLIPVEISDVYPASHNVFSNHSSDFEAGDYGEFIKLFNSFLKNNHFKTVYIIADSFMKKMLSFLQLPDETELKIEDFVDFTKSDRFL